MTRPFALIRRQALHIQGVLHGDHVFTHNLLIGGATVVAGFFGVAFQSLVSHQFRPADYGSVFAVITLVTLVGLPASAFTLLMARETSRGQASGHQALSANLLRRGNRALIFFGTALACLVALMSPLIAGFLGVPPELAIAAAVGLPFALALPLLLGEFQGQQRFEALALLLIGQAGIKLIGAIVLGIVFGPLGVIAGISLASLLIYLVALRMLRSRLTIKANLSWWRPAAGYLAVVLPSTLCLAVLLSADVILVKHFFPSRISGEYAAVAALGRAIFWGASGVAAVLFPKLVFRITKGTSGLHLVGASLLLVVIGGLAGFFFLAISARWLLTAFAGGAYANAAEYLPWYAVGMTVLGGVAVLIATHQSHGRAGFLLVLVPFTLLEPILLTAFHPSLLQVVRLLDLSVGMLLVGLAILYVIEERSGLNAPAHVANTALVEQRAVELVTSQ